MESSNHYEPNSRGCMDAHDAHGKERVFDLDNENLTDVSTEPRSSLDPPRQAESTTLCSRCAAIDFPSIFRQRVYVEDGHFILDLGADIRKLEAASCPLCRLFASMAPSDFELEGQRARPSGCHLRALSARRLFSNMVPFKFSPAEDGILIAVARIDLKIPWANWKTKSLLRSVQETGLLGSIEEDEPSPLFGVRPISPIAFDVEFARSQIEYCNQNHGEACHIQTCPLVFRVIDCQTNSIVQAGPECRYVALSYVWGSPQDCDLATVSKESIQSILDRAPKGITDAIDVTVALGFQYIWIDRYCIDQSDEKDRLDQIQQMDTIYANAQVTIIAAAGLGPNFGLPGVNGTRRLRQPGLVLGDRILLSTLPHPKWIVSHSKWASRGWTFQEGLLSKRRLIFTEHQLLFECNGMHSTEARTQPLDRLHDKNHKKFLDAVPRGVFDRIAISTGPWEISSHLYEFSKRELTYPEDTLNAMQGLFRVLERAEPPIYQILGVPFVAPSLLPVPNYRRPRHKGKNLKAQVHSVAESFLVGLTWFTAKAGSRREQFPSWSWAGWTGIVSKHLMVERYWNFNLEDSDASNFIQSSEQSRYRVSYTKYFETTFFAKATKIRIEDYSGTLHEIPSLENLSTCTPQVHTNGTHLEIEATTWKCCIQYIPFKKYQWPPWEFSVLISLDEETTLSNEVHLDYKMEMEEIEQLKQESFTAIFLNDVSDDFPVQLGPIALVVRENAGIAERVGCFIVRGIMQRSGVADSEVIGEREWGILKSGPRRRICIG